MKRRIILLAASALALVSCGSAKQFADASQNQQFRDEVYYNPKGSGADRQARTIAKVEEDLLVKKTKESPIFMKSGEKVDTLFIPEGKNARIEFDKEGSTTSVFVTDSGWETWYAYQPWYARTWYTPFHSSLYWGANPWYYAGWYDPWYYGRWYDPWYFGAGWSFGWYDPWYCGGWYDPCTMDMHIFTTQDTEVRDGTAETGSTLQGPWPTAHPSGAASVPFQGMQAAGVPRPPGTGAD